MVGEYNIGSLANIIYVIENITKIQPAFEKCKVRFYDGLINHPSNGGLTTTLLERISDEDVDLKQESLIGDIYSLGIKFDQILTNFYFTKEYIDSRVIRRLNFLSQFDGQGVTVSSAEIAKYIRKRYPKLLIRWSITAAYRDNPKNIKNYVDSVLKEADRVVLPVEYNNKYDILSALPTDNIELIVLDNCGSGCPFRKLHYTLSSKDQLKVTSPEDMPNFNLHFCDIVHKLNKNVPKGETTFVSPYQLEKLMEIGINKFKLASRNFIHSTQIPYYLGYTCAVMYNERPVDDLNAEDYQYQYIDLINNSKELQTEFKELQ